MTTITLHASSFAGFIGKHPYVKHHEAFEKTWQRISPDTYMEAMRRHDRTTDQQRLEILRAKIPEIEVSLHAAETSHPASSKVAAELADEIKHDVKTIPNLTPQEVDLVNNEIRKQVCTRYGTDQERSVIDLLNDEMGMDVVPDETTYARRYTTPNGIPWKLVGKIDGHTVDAKTVVEVKNRVNRLFMHATEYERIQVECYLRLIDVAERALLVESLSGSSCKTLNIIPIEKDDALWAEWYRVAETYVDYLHRMIDDVSLQDTYLDSKRPSAFLRNIVCGSVRS
jgi:hypothetical protein